jgi:hypothetical protein
VSLQLVGNPIARAAGQRGAKASVESGGRRYGPASTPPSSALAPGGTIRANPVPPRQVRARARGRLWLRLFFSPLTCLLRLKSEVMWRRWVGPPTISRSVDLISSGGALPTATHSTWASGRASRTPSLIACRALSARRRISAGFGPPKDVVALCSEAIVTSLPDPVLHRRRSVPIGVPLRLLSGGQADLDVDGDVR